MLKFTREYVEKQGGKVVGEEYLPMDGTDWTPIVSKIRSAQPGALISSTAGGSPNVGLAKQIRAAGLSMPYGNRPSTKARPGPWATRRRACTCRRPT